MRLILLIAFMTSLLIEFVMIMYALIKERMCKCDDYEQSEI